MVTVTMNGKGYEVESGVTLKELAKQYGTCEKGDIVLAYQNGHLCELHRTVTEDCEVEWVPTTNKIGLSSYKRSMILMMMKAFRDVLKTKGTTGRIRVLFSLSKGFYCELDKSETVVTPALLQEVEARMRELCEADIQIEKSTYKSHDIMKRFEKQGRMDKVQLFKYRRASNAKVER